MTDRKLAYRMPLQCVGHEIAPPNRLADKGATYEAEIVVAGYSFCYPCGNMFLHYHLQGTFSDQAILRMFSDGVIEVSP